MDLSIHEPLDALSGGGRLRRAISDLARAATGGLISTERAAAAWGTTRSIAATRLHRLVASEWLQPVRKGLFYLRPLEASGDTTIDDPWILAAEAYRPCYIGGWSAAEHWGLTEQIFRSTFVVTAGAARVTSEKLIGAEYRLVRVSQERVKAVPPIWRRGLRIAVADRERTLADALENPDWVGGIRHLAEMMTTYRQSEHWNPVRLLAAMAAHPKGAAYKRLGYLVEKVLGGDPTIVNEALAHRSAGVIKLDPQGAAHGSLSTRWGLSINLALVPADEADSS